MVSYNLPEAPGRDFTSILQTISVTFLGIVALACGHALLYHLHAVLAPFILAGFLVFAVEPSVEVIYRGLAGLSPPYRWCCICAVRRWKRPKQESEDGSNESDDSMSDSESQERSEKEMLLGEDSADDGCGLLMMRILDGLCRFAAVILVLAAMILTLLTLVSLLARELESFRVNWNDYKQGMLRMTNWLDSMRDFLVVQLKLSGNIDVRLKTVYTNVLSRFQDLILDVVNNILGAVTGGVYFAVIMILYMLFWLLRPLPIAGKANDLVHSYIWKKTVVSSLYGSSVAFLLHVMGIDLAIFFGLVTFSLNYVPEVGALIAMIAPLPVILLDGKQHSPFLSMTLAIVGFIILKLVFGNILELRLIQDDKEMRIHPVWVLLGLNYFGFIWGPVGMLISVPLMAMMKSMIAKTAEDVEEVNVALFAQDLLACLEGRKRWREKREIKKRTSCLVPALASLTPQKTVDSPAESTVDVDEEMGSAPKRPRPEGERKAGEPASSDAAT